MSNVQDAPATDADTSSGPDFGPLSLPFPAAVHALNHPDRPDTPNDPRLTHDLTDARHAEKFALEFGDDLKFDARRGCWRKYDSVRWAAGDSAAVRDAIKFARMRQRDALEIRDRAIRETAVIQAIRAEARHAIDNVLSLARHMPPMRDDGDLWDSHPWLLGCPNGVVNLQTGVMRAATPADRITLITNTPFYPHATAPRWRRFIDEIFDGNHELAAFVQKSVGYSLTGDVSEQAAFLCVGAGANGKSTFLSTLTEVFGDLAHTMPFSTVERSNRGAIPNDLAALAGRRFVTASEPSEGARWNEARLKSLTGSEPISARFLHAEWFSFRPIGKFWFALNNKPDARDDSYGFWRRLRLIPFPRTFPIDKTLAPALLNEAPGVLAWAVAGCQMWLQDGLETPAVVLAATDEYREDSDPLSEFLETAVDTVEHSEVAASELYGHYRDWARGRGLNEREQLSATMFGRRMSERLPWVKKPNGRFYQGVARRVMAGLGQ